MKYKYYTNCVNSTSDKINALIDSSKNITYETFINHIDIHELKALFPFYGWNNKKVLKMKDDYAISYSKGIYEGKKVYFLTHSCIEYIFIN